MPIQILNKYQIEFLKVFSTNTWSKDFYLAGGTALAHYHFQHRLSDDLDFFSPKPFSVTTIGLFLQNIKKPLKIKDISKQHLYDRYIYTLHYQDGFELKVEFTLYFKPHYPLQQDKTLHIQVENKQDIFLDKLAAVMDRTEIKDYVDIYTLYPHIKNKNATDLRFFESIAPTFEKKFGYKIIMSVLAYCFFRGTELAYDALKNHMQKPLNIDQLKKFFLSLSNALKKNSLE